ncbi:MAG: cbb3-type cytochrome c oxidase subunit I [Ignavibacteria bacterium]|nr:cbb3-type cytochrome c oxidase subunit I [Ignavibacteria bacterium]
MANGTIAAHGTAEVDFYHVKSKHKGLLAWLLTTDHKRIGIMYLSCMTVFFLTAMTFGVLMRLEMLTPGMTIMTAQTYNSLFTLHGVIMIFLFIIPGIPAVFGNFFLPIQIGAMDVQFPRLNLLSWYLYIIGGGLAIFSLFGGGGWVDTGWTFYVPYSVRTTTNVSMSVFAAFVLGFSSILTGLNFITTIHRLRCPGMTFFRMPLFIWSIYATSWIQVLATPVIGITLVLIILERAFGIGVFDPTLGGDPILYQHLFWIYSHPAVYIMILPAMGVVSEIIPTFARKPIFGYVPIAISSLAIALVGYLVWGHHMFSSGISDTSRVIFSLLTFIVALPSGIKVFNWVATLYKGSIVMSAPMLYAMLFIFIFSIGGLTGLVLGALNTDLHVTDTYYVVAHFHYVMFGGMGIIFFASVHYWFPKMFGKMYNEKMAKVAAIIIGVGFNVLYFPMFIMGYMGMPRRYYDYLPEFQIYHLISTVGSWILVSGILIMIANLLSGLRNGSKASSNPWEGTTLEWTVPSPPPLLNFDKIPTVDHGPYEHPEIARRKEEESK